MKGKKNIKITAFSFWNIRFGFWRVYCWGLWVFLYFAYNEVIISLITLGFCFFFSRVFGILSYLSWDPMKRRFYLILSLLGLCPLLSVCGHVWYSYYVCMLFLSGVFVIIVYFSSLCFYVYSVLVVFVFVCFMLIFGFDFLLFDYVDLSGLEFSYWVCYLCFMFWLVGIIFLFLGFVNFFLNFCGALRSVFVSVFVWFDNSYF